MDAIFMNCENAKTSDSHRLLINISDNIDLQRSDKYVAVSDISIYYIWRNTKKSYKNSKFKLSSSKGNEKFELPDASYSVSDFQDNFEYIIKKHDTFTDNPPIKYINIIEYT